MLKPKSWEVCQGLFLVCHAISVAAAPPPAPEPTHHFLLLDVSGSMASELPPMRAQINAKLLTLLGPNDAVSIIWFSGRGECDVLLEVVEPTVADLANIRKAVDRWLRPVGLTGFKEPIERAGEIMRRLKAKGGARRNNFLFMSDGCDNIWPRPEILRAIDAIRDDVASATVVEYGFYADHPFLTTMAERLGGALILAADFAAYEPVFESAMQRKRGGAKKTTVLLDAHPAEGFAYAFDGDEILSFSPDVTGGKAGVAVPSHLSAVCYLSTVSVGEPQGRLAAAAFSASMGSAGPAAAGVISATYAAAALFAQRVKPGVVWHLLRALGDVDLIDDFGVCFGRQRYAAFVEKARMAATSGKWFAKGYDPKRAPREDAYTLLQFFKLLASDPRCRVIVDTDAFQYNRIGRKSVTKDQMLTVGEADEVKSLAEELKAVAEGRLVAPIQEHMAKIAAVVSGRKKALRFQVDEAAAEAGYHPELVWNEDMTNLSFRVRKPGVVDLSGVEMSAEMRAFLPKLLPTFQYKSYTAVKDGLPHIEWLPVVLPQDKFDTLVAVGAIDPSVDAAVPFGDCLRVVVDLRKLPVVNQKMVSEASARDLAIMAWELLELKAAAKVFNFFAPERESTGFQEKYGPVATQWLDEHDVSESGGYHPEVTRAPATDFYLARALKVKIPGFSSFPAVEDVRERMKALDAAKALGERVVAKKPKAINPPGLLMVPALRAVEAFLASQEYAGAEDPKAAFEKWAAGKERETNGKKRDIQARVAFAKFAMLISGQWFREFGSWDEHTLRLDLGGEAREVDFELREDVKVEV